MAEMLIHLPENSAKSGNRQIYTRRLNFVKALKKMNLSLHICVKLKFIFNSGQ